MKKKHLLRLIIVLAAGLTVGWYLSVKRGSLTERPEEAVAVFSPAERAILSQPAVQAPQRVLSEESVDTIADFPGLPSVEKPLSGVSAEKRSSVVSVEELVTMLPQWMQEKGELLSDSRLVSGVQVVRSRSRYVWDNGSSMEVEISDAGADVPDEVLAALGFDLQMTNNVNETGFSTVVDHDDMLINYEYQYGDAAGSIQMIISNRFLVEIQLQKLPQESFQLIIDEQLSISELMSLDGNPSF